MHRTTTWPAEPEEKRGRESFSDDETTKKTPDPFFKSAVRVIAAVAVVGLLWWGQAVLIPIVVSVLIACALEPLVGRLVSLRVPRPIAVPLLLTSLLTLAGVGSYALRGEVIAFVNGLPGAAHTVAQGIQDLARGKPGPVAKVQDAARELETAARTASGKNAADRVPAVRVYEPTFKWSDWLWQSSYGAAALGAQLLAVLCLVYYLLASGDLYKRKLVRIMPTLTDKKITVGILDEIDRQIERYLVARLLINVVVGIAVWIGLRLLGLDEPGVWGVLAGVLFTIPIFGPTLLVIAAALAAFVQFGTVGAAAAAGGVCILIGTIEANVLTPLLMIRVGEMNAVAVFVSLLFWGWLWGAWGLLLAVPITAAAKAACDRIPELHAYAELLGT